MDLEVPKIINKLNKEFFWDPQVYDIQVYPLKKEIKFTVINYINESKERVLEKICLTGCRSMQYIAPYTLDLYERPSYRIRQEGYLNDYLYAGLTIVSKNTEYTRVNCCFQFITIEAEIQAIEYGTIPLYHNKNELSLKNYEMYFNIPLEALYAKLSYYFSMEILDMRIANSLDDYEFIFKDINNKLYYVCLARAVASNIIEVDQAVFKFKLEQVRAKDYTTIYTEPYQTYIRDGENDFFLLEFVHNDVCYKIMFKMFNSGELPEDVTTFDHKFFYDEIE